MVSRTVWSAAMAAAKKVSWSEIAIPCSDGTMLAAQRWETSISPSVDERRILVCVHGWMDNCRSFYNLAPQLAAAKNNYDVVALDLPGHGHSSHLSRDAVPPSPVGHVYYLSEAIENLIDDSMEDDQRRVTVVGHSMGGAICSMYAAAFPERVQQLVMLEGGVVPGRAHNTATHIRRHIERRRLHETVSKLPKVYPSLHAAVQARVVSAERFSGPESLSYEAAEELVRRAIRYVEPEWDDENRPLTGEEHEEAVQFIHDPRITWPYNQYMTWEQGQSILESLHETDCCLLTTTDGYQFPEKKYLQDVLQPRVFQNMTGGHFFHVNPSTANEVADVLLDFLEGE